VHSGIFAYDGISRKIPSTSFSLGEIMTDALLQNTTTGLENRYVSLAEEIRTLLLKAFIDGELTAGRRVNDVELAKKLGVSRTPVREALRGLQTLGIIETLPARITRVVSLSAQEFEHAKIVWASLYRMLLHDTINHLTDTHIAEMTKLCSELAEIDDHKNATVSFRFFDTLGSLTKNTFLRESIHAAACRMRLGHHNTTDGTHNFLRPTFAQAQEFLTAMIQKDLNKAHHALNQILGTPPVNQLAITEPTTKRIPSLV
jgi:DNA-binding GntR family transcriptional regulator